MEDSKTSKPKDLVGKMTEILKTKGSSLAQTFPELKYVKQAEGKPDDEQRKLINKQLRLELGAKPVNTSIARLALDDHCSTSDYLNNFKKHALPLLA